MNKCILFLFGLIFILIISVTNVLAYDWESFGGVDETMVLNAPSGISHNIVITEKGTALDKYNKIQIDSSEVMRLNEGDFVQFDNVILYLFRFSTTRSTWVATFIVSGSKCTPYHHKQCYDGEPYWYDSCGNLQDRAQMCGTPNYCTNGECILNPANVIWCGDGKCDTGETCSNCRPDCSCAGNQECVNNVCSNTYCGNNKCDTGETCSSCNRDCGPCANQITCTPKYICDGNDRVYQSADCSQAIPQRCIYGCKDGLCLTTSLCTSTHINKRCYGGNFYWLDSCNQLSTELAENCGNLGCDDSGCKNKSCVPFWVCSNWSSCYKDVTKQYRTCNDGCGSPERSEEQICYASKDGCISSLTCGNWSSCVSDKQTRTCSNGCGSSDTIEEQVCDSSIKTCDNDNRCSDTQSCNTGICKEISCEEGFVRNHQCIKYECVSDSQCQETSKCNMDIHKCIEQTGCIKVLDNGDSNTKVDFLIIGAEYSDYVELKSTIETLFSLKSDKYLGFFGVEPFKSNKNKFNIWMIKAPDYNIRSGTDCSTNCVEAIDWSQDANYASNCPNADFIITIFKDAKFRSCAGGGQWDSLTCESNTDKGKLIIHESGHSFGGLADEYIEPMKGSRPHGPNCVSTQQEALALWGDLIGKKDVGFFQGCSYTENNIRSAKNSFMRDQRSAISFGPVNERAILKILESYQ